MKRISVKKSTNISEIGYDETTKTIEIKFKHGGLYQYSPISLLTYISFLRARSKGEFFNKNIKNNTSLKFKKI